MNTARLRSLVLYIILAGFVGGILFFIVCFFLQGGSWAMRPSNGHLQGETQLSNAGTITDRNGTVIAQSIDGKRVYADDYTTRRALLHVLGDTNGYISTGIQSEYLSKLTGFNPFLGVMRAETSGSSIQLTVDSGLSALALREMGSRKGAIVLYNYKTGEVLCDVSTPTFDPSDVPEDINSNPDYDGAFLNKALSSTFTPGSTFKVVTAACALENIPDIESRTFTCQGEKTVNGNVIACDDHTAHGKQSLQEALTNSCNVAFAEISVELGSSKLRSTAEKMGFNKSFSVDDNHTVASSYQANGSSSEDELAWSGIGQFSDTANPIHMMILMGAIANDGVPVLPHTVSSASPLSGLSGNAGQTGARMLESGTASQLKTLMRNNVANGYGDHLFPGMEVCAKSGTAEIAGKTSTGWFVGFSRNESTPYAFAVVVEEGGYGLSSAGAIASEMMQYLA